MHGSFTALAQDENVPAAPAQMPEPVPAPALKVRFGVTIGNYNNGRVRGAIVVGVYPNSPATRVRVKRTRQDGSVVYGEPTTMIRGDIITRLVETEAGNSWRISGFQDLIDAIQNLPPGAEFEISGYDAGNRYRPFTAALKLTGGGGGGGGGGDLAESGRVRALLIADTDSKLPGLRENLDTIRSLLAPLQQENRCSIDELQGGKVNRAQITNWVNNQGDASRDSVFIYYCGHGATDMNSDPAPAQRTFGHYLALTNGQPLFRSTLRTGLAQRRPRLTVLITECCSNVSPVAPLAAPPVMEPGLARSLFLKTQGIVDFTAATFDPQTGTEESAWTGPAGGIFTLSLGHTVIGVKLDDLDRNPRDGLVTWTEVFPLVRQATIEDYQGFRESVLMNPDQYRPKLVADLRGQPQQNLSCHLRRRPRVP